MTRGHDSMADLFWLITLGVPAVVLVVAVLVIFYALGQKKSRKFYADTQYDGIIQTLEKSGKPKHR